MMFFWNTKRLELKNSLVLFNILQELQELKPL